VLCTETEAKFYHRKFALRTSQILLLNRQNLYRKLTARSILPRVGEIVKPNEKRAARQILNLFYVAA